MTIKIRKANYKPANRLEEIRDKSALSLIEAAIYLGVSPLTLKNYGSDIPHKRLGGRYIYSKRNLDKWLDGSE